MADTTHAVVRTDNMYGTDVRAALVSVEYMGDAGSTPTAIDNGNVVVVGELMTGEREIRKGTKLEKKTHVQDMALIASPEVMYDERKKNLEEYYNEAGKPCRGYRLHDGDIFSVTKEALTGEASPAVGHVIQSSEGGTKLTVATAATDDTTSVGKIIAIDKVGRYTYYVIQVIDVPAQGGDV